MARINHSFGMPVAPARAQAMFVRDIAPALHRLRGFSLYENVPGRLAFGDGRDLPVAEVGVLGPPRWMRRISERRITVTFTAEATGTRVIVKGGAERDARDALQQLGEPGRWPENAPSWSE